MEDLKGLFVAYVGMIIMTIWGVMNTLTVPGEFVEIWDLSLPWISIGLFCFQAIRIGKGVRRDYEEWS